MHTSPTTDGYGLHPSIFSLASSRSSSVIFTPSFFNVSSSPLGLGELCKLLCDFRRIYHRVWGCIRSCGLSCAASCNTFTALQSVGRVKKCFILKILINFNCCLVCFSCHHSCLRAVEARLCRHSLSRELSALLHDLVLVQRPGPVHTLQSLRWRDQFRLPCLLRLALILHASAKLKLLGSLGALVLLLTFQFRQTDLLYSPDWSISKCCPVSVTGFCLPCGCQWQ